MRRERTIDFVFGVLIVPSLCWRRWIDPNIVTVPSQLADIFDHHAEFDPTGDFEQFARLAPARWVVYLLADADDRPVQLLCVKNLRNSVKRRLGAPDAAAGPNRRVDYRAIIRRVHWRRVDSALEADWIYFEAARLCFPQTYRGIVGLRPAWFIHVNPDANFPRYVKTTDLSIRTGTYVGPLEDKHAAARLIQLIEDLFDLCRYYNILIEAPNGRACAYKEMGKCPAPCDGSISMGQYRWLMEWSLQVLADPAPYVREQTQRMQAAAAELQFELAGKIKQYVDHLSELSKGPFRHARRLKDFAFVSFEHGPRQETAKVFLLIRGQIVELLGITGADFRASEVMRVALERAAEHELAPIDSPTTERIGLIAHQLFSPKTRGVVLRLDSISESAITKAYRDLTRQQIAIDEESESEGVLKELQAL